MAETLIRGPVNQDLFSAPSFSGILIQEISDAKNDIEKLTTTTNGGWLTDDQESARIGLNRGINANLVYFLSLRREIIYDLREADEESNGLSDVERQFGVKLEMFPNDPIHPFSDNRISIFVPSTIRPGSTFEIFTNLNFLRSANVTNSVQALELIGGHSVHMNPHSEFLIKKINWELKSVEREIYFAKLGKSGYPLESLDELRRDLMQRRETAIEHQTAV